MCLHVTFFMEAKIVQMFISMRSVRLAVSKHRFFLLVKISGQYSSLSVKEGKKCTMNDIDRALAWHAASVSKVIGI